MFNNIPDCTDTTCLYTFESLEYYYYHYVCSRTELLTIVIHFQKLVNKVNIIIIIIIIIVVVIIVAKIDKI